MPVRLTAALLALAGGVAAVVLAALLVQRTPGPVSAAPAPAPVSAPPPQQKPANRFPAPPPGAVVLAREAGPDALAVAVTPSAVQVSVVGQQANGVSGLAVTVNGEQTTACGAGCYRASVSDSRTLDVHVAATRWLVAVPRPRDGTAIVGRAARVWRALHTLVFTDRLGSDATHVVRSRWTAVAPNRLSYVIRGGYSAVIVGGRRWDRAPHGKWIESPQTVQVRQPAPLWQSETDANVVRETTSAWRVTFYDPRTPAWFAITVDKRTGRTLELDMTTIAHFMHERYGPFDARIAVRPPTSP